VSKNVTSVFNDFAHDRIVNTVIAMQTYRSSLCK